MEFKKFNHGALKAYEKWLKERHHVDVVVHDPPELEQYTSLLSGTADAIVESKRGASWPIMVKFIWQPSYGEVRTVEEIAKGRGENFYLQQDSNGIWSVKQFSPVYFSCQNIMMMHGYDTMDLICFSERNGSILVVTVPLEKEHYFANLESVHDFVQAGGASAFCMEEPKCMPTYGKD